MFKKYLPSLYDGIRRALPQRRSSRRTAPLNTQHQPAAEPVAIVAESAVLPLSPAEPSDRPHASPAAQAYQKLAEALKQHGMMADAARYYRKAIEHSGDRTGSALLQQAADYCASEQWEAAIATCEQAAQLEPTAEAYRLWGNALRALGQIDAAQSRYQEAIALQPDWAELHGNLGSLYAQQQRWEDAIACYQRAIALKPDFAGAYRNLARVWTHLEQTDAAHQCWYEALMLEPEQVSAAEHINFGNLLLKQDQTEQAIACYRQAIALDPAIGGAYQNLAEALSRQGRWEDAANYYRKAIALAVQPLPPVLPDRSVSPWETAAAQIQSAAALADAADWDAAIAACEQAMAQFEPQAISAYKTWGNALYAQGRIAEAIRCYVWITKLQPDAAEEHANLGSLYAQQQQWSEAIACYQTALRLKPDFAGAYRNLARVWQQTGNAIAAAECWYEALTLEPDHATAAEHLKLGQTLRDQGKPDAAIACCRRATERNPGLTAAFEQLGALLEQQQQWNAAIACYRQAVAHHPQAAALHGRLAALLEQQQQWDAAIACYQTVTNLQPDALAAHRRLGELLVQQQRWDEAIACHQRLTELEPEAWQHYHQLGDACNRQRQWQRAADAYQQAVRLNPQFCWSHNNLGDALIQLGQWQAAAAALRQAIALNPDFHWSHYNLGEALAQLGDWQGAIAAYRRALDLCADLPYAAQKLGDALLQRAQQDLSEALACYQQAIRQQPDEVQNYHKAIELKPDDADLYVGLGNALATQNQLDGAIVFYQMALQLQPQDPEAALQLARVLARQQQPAPACDPLADAYAYWLRHNTPQPEELARRSAAVASLPYQPLISVVMPVFNPAKSFLVEAVQSVLSQVYPHWELCIADDASTLPHVRSTLEAYAAQDARIKVVFRPENGHISACSNSAIALATGEFICLLDHDDVLAPEALWEVVSLLNQHPEADLIYSDEDKLNVLGDRTSPFFKPDWCPDSFLSRMYTCHLGTYRRSLIEQIGGFRLGYEGAQDWDLVLRLTEHTDRIFHLPKVLYHWRSHPGSTAGSATAKTYAYQAAEKVLTEALARRGEPGRVLANYQFPGWYTVRYEITAYKLVSIIIPTRNLGKMLDRCLQSIFEKSTYPHYEVVLIDNGSDEVETAAVIDRWQRQEPQRFRCHPLDIPFNYARLNNVAAQHARGDYLLFLNNDTEVISPDWIEALVEQAQRSTVGAVGALLLYPDRSVQHAGVVLGIGDVAGHSHKHADSSRPGYFGQTVTVNNYTAVTGACLMCQRSRFEQVGGFDEQLAVAYNDVDLCLKLVQQGYRNVYVPHALLYHHESKSRGYEDTPAKQRRYRQEVALMQQRWGAQIGHDPCYSPNLSRHREDYALNLKTQVNVTSVTAAETAGDRRWNGCIDSPQVGTVFDVTCLTVRGWVLSAAAPAAEVEIVCQDEVLQTVPVSAHRPDVAAVYAIAGADSSGYQTELRLSTVPPAACLHLRLVLADGDRLPLGQIRLRHTVGAAVLQPQGEPF